MASAGDRESNESIESSLALAKRGDADARKVLFDRLARPLLAVATAEGAPDPVRSTNAILVKVFDELGRFAGDEADLCAFAYRTARFHLVDEGRLRSRTVTPEEDDLSISLVRNDGSPTPVDGSGPLSASDLNYLVVQATKLLSAAQREVIALRVFFGLTIPCTAQATGLDEDEVVAVQRRVESRFARLDSS